MASIYDLGSLTIEPQEETNVQAIIAPILYSDEKDFLKKHNLITGISGKTQIVLADGNGNSGWLDTGCTPPESGGMGLDFTQLYWDLKTIGDQKIHCQADVDQNFKMIVKKFAADHTNLEGSPAVLQYILARLVTFIEETRERLAYLGDTAAVLDTNAGYIKTGVDIRFYNSLDGWWKQIFTGVGLTTIPRFTVPANATATKALQLTLGSTAGYDALSGMWNNSNDALKADAKAYFELTPALYWNYNAYLMTLPASNGGFTSVIVDGVPKMAFQGKPIYISSFIGNKILSDMQVLDNGYTPAVATYNLPNRGIFTTPENVPFATLSDSDIKKIESFYYQKDRVNIMRYAFDMDVKVLRPALISVAY